MITFISSWSLFNLHHHKATFTLNLKGCNKEELGLFATKIRSWRPPEPYKGKGILYENERVLRKAGKSGKK